MKCPLSGKPCNKYKGFHITEKAAGKVETHSVCEDCLYTQFQKKENENELLKPCSKCGTTLDTVIKGGQLGCAICYEEFGENLIYIISALQGGNKDIKHTGNVPESWKISEAEKTIPIKFATELAYKLKSASKNEEYEKASFIKNNLEKFSTLLLRLQQADEERAPSIKKALADFIYEYRKNESS